MTEELRSAELPTPPFRSALFMALLASLVIAMLSVGCGGASEPAPTVPATNASGGHLPQHEVAGPRPTQVGVSARADGAEAPE